MAFSHEKIPEKLLFLRRYFKAFLSERSELFRAIEDEAYCLDRLSPSLQLEFKSNLGSRSYELLEQIAHEEDPDQFSNLLNSLADHHLSQNQDQFVFEIDQFLQSTGYSNIWIQRSRSRWEQMKGIGRVEDRIHLMTKRFLDHAFDLKNLTSLVVAGSIYRTARVGLWSKMLNRPHVSWWNSGLTSKVIASLGATTLEVPSFVATHRALNVMTGEENSQTWGHELLSAGVILGVFKITGAASQLGLAKLHRVDPLLGFPLKLQGIYRWNAVLFTQSSLYAGMILSARLQASLGLSPHLTGNSEYVDAASNVLSLGLGMKIAHHVTQPLLGAHELNLAIQARFLDIQSRGDMGAGLGHQSDRLPGLKYAYATKPSERLFELEAMLMEAMNYPSLGDAKDSQERIEAIGFQIFDLASQYKAPPRYRLLKWARFKFHRFQDQMTATLSDHPDLLHAVMSFTDLLPDSKSAAEIYSAFRQYFPSEDRRLPGLINFGIRMSQKPWIESFRPGKYFFTRGVRFGIAMQASRYLVGDNADKALPKLYAMLKEGKGIIFDFVGEAVETEAEEKAYLKQYMDLLDGLAKKAPKIKKYVEVNRQRRIQMQSASELKIKSFAEKDQMDFEISVKLSSFYAEFNPLDPEGTSQAVIERLKPLIQKMRVLEENTGLKIGITIDLEQDEYVEVSYKIFKDLFSSGELISVERPQLGRYKDMNRIGIVVQAYRKDALAVLQDLSAWSALRANSGGAESILIRLVKGAYWDFESKEAAHKGFELPVFDGKVNSDYNYELMTDFLFANSEYLRPAFGSHNVRSISSAMEKAHRLGKAAEFQMLYGMVDKYQYALVQMGIPLRVYAPVGKMLPGMAYNARRLLENGSQQGFIQMSMGNPDRAKQKILLGDPSKFIKKDLEKIGLYNFEGKRTNLDTPFSELGNEALWDFSKAVYREKVLDALRDLRQNHQATSSESKAKFFSNIIGESFDSEGVKKQSSVNPNNPLEVIGEYVEATPEMAQAAVKLARENLVASETNPHPWGQWTARERAEVLLNAAQVMRKRRATLTALMILEAGKPWREADGDVAEAIDFLEFYARDIVGKTTALEKVQFAKYQVKGKGVAGVIAPWNFPLAILTGMSSAALAAGNTVVMKPAPQTPITGAYLHQIYMDAKIPKGAVTLVFGGLEVGEALRGLKGEWIDGERIVHEIPDGVKVNQVLFTGSAKAGKTIYAQDIPRGIDVIGELGGKNWMIIDPSAHSDDVLRTLRYTKLGFSGQKCSATDTLIVVAPNNKAGDAYYEAQRNRIYANFAGVKVGNIEDPAYFMGAMIDDAARSRLLGRIQEGIDQGWGSLILDGRKVKKGQTGYILNPSIFEISVKQALDPNNKLMQEEYFGPVLNIVRVHSREEAKAMTEITPFALTGAVMTRLPDNRKWFEKNLKVGMLYIDRGQTGAVVGRNPFGGFYLSGIGAKAGGHLYGWQLMSVINLSQNQRNLASTQKEIVGKVGALMGKPIYYQSGLLGEINKVQFTPRADGQRAQKEFHIDASHTIEDWEMKIRLALLQGNKIILYANRRDEVNARGLMEKIGSKNIQFYRSDYSGMERLPKEVPLNQGVLLLHQNMSLLEAHALVTAALESGNSLHVLALPGQGIKLNRLMDQMPENKKIETSTLKSTDDLKSMIQAPHVKWIAVGKGELMDPILIDAVTWAAETLPNQSFVRPVIRENIFTELPAVLIKLVLPQTIIRNTTRHGHSHVEGEQIEVHADPALGIQ